MTEHDALLPTNAQLRGRLALALDLPDLSAALSLCRLLGEYFSIAKVGLELYSAAGPRAVEELRDAGYAVFVDLKLHDIPTTVRRAAAVLASLGASYLTVHAAGGAAMLAAAQEGLLAGAPPGGASPIGLGVTVLTSEANPPAGLLGERAGLVAEAGLGGLVCSALDLALVRRAAPGLLTVVPGTRQPGEGHDDQARVATPAEAIASGADILVIGRGVTASPDPLAAARLLHAGLDGAVPR